MNHQKQLSKKGMHAKKIAVLDVNGTIQDTGRVPLRLCPKMVITIKHF